MSRTRSFLLQYIFDEKLASFVRRTNQRAAGSISEPEIISNIFPMLELGRSYVFRNLNDNNKAILMKLQQQATKIIHYQPLYVVLLAAYTDLKSHNRLLRNEGLKKLGFNNFY